MKNKKNGQDEIITRQGSSLVLRTASSRTRKSIQNHVKFCFLTENETSPNGSRLSWATQAMPTGRETSVWHPQDVWRPKHLPTHPGTVRNHRGWPQGRPGRPSGVRQKKYKICPFKKTQAYILFTVCSTATAGCQHCARLISELGHSTNF